MTDDQTPAPGITLRVENGRLVLDSPDWLTPGEVAALFRVDAKTVTRWAQDNRLPVGAVIVTLGGHRRYARTAIEDQLNNPSVPARPAPTFGRSGSNGDGP